MERNSFRGKESSRGEETGEPASGEAEATSNDRGPSLHHFGMVAPSIHNFPGRGADRPLGVDLLSFRWTQTGRSNFWGVSEGGTDRECAKRQFAKRSVWSGADRAA